MLKRLSHLAPWERNLGAAVIVELLALMSFQAGFILIPFYIQEMGVTDLGAVAAWTGAYQSVGAIGFTIFTPTWAALGDRYGRKLMLVRAMASTALVLGLMGLVRTPTQLMILRVVQGCTTGTPAAATALVAIGSPKERLAYVMGLVQTSVFVGMSLGPMVGGHIADAFGYRATFFAGSAVALVATLLVVFLITEPAESVQALERSRIEHPLAGFRDLLALPRLTGLIAVAFALNLVNGLIGPVLPIFIQQLVPDPARLASTAGTITGLAALSAAVSTLAVGRLSDRIGHRRTLVGCTGGASLVLMSQALARSVASLGVARSIQGLFQGGISPSLSALVAGSAPREKIGSALGLSTSASSAGFAIGPLLGALLLGAAGIRATFAIAGALLAATTAALMLMRDPSATLAPADEAEEPVLDEPEPATVEQH